MKRSFGGKVCQVRRGVKVCLWTPYMVAKFNRYVMAPCDGGQVASCDSCVVREWYAGEVCQVTGGKWRLLPDDEAAKRHCDMETWFYGGRVT